MSDIVNERNNSLKSWVQLTLAANFAVTALEVGTSKWSSMNSYVDLSSADGAPQFLQLAFWAQTHHSTSPYTWDTAYDMDIAVFARQVTYPGAANPSAMFPLFVGRVAWSATPSDMLTTDTYSPMQGAVGLVYRIWYAALTVDLTLPSSGPWVAQNPFGPEVLQQAARSPLIQIPLKGFNQIALMCRRGGSSTSPGTTLVGYKLR